MRTLQSNSKNEVLKRCPNCDYGEFISLDAEKFTCMKCQTKICPQCNIEPPHPGITCKKNRERIKKLEEEEQKGEEKIEGLMQCPKCGFLIERSDGCNFMTCISGTCNKKTYFCYLCGKELKYT